jgi:hypothetical protein
VLRIQTAILECFECPKLKDTESLLNAIAGLAELSIVKPVVMWKPYADRTERSMKEKET